MIKPRESSLSLSLSFFKKNYIPLSSEGEENKREERKKGNSEQLF